MAGFETISIIIKQATVVGHGASIKAVNEISLIASCHSPVMLSPWLRIQYQQTLAPLLLLVVGRRASESMVCFPALNHIVTSATMTNSLIKLSIGSCDSVICICFIVHYHDPVEMTTPKFVYHDGKCVIIF